MPTQIQYRAVTERRSLDNTGLDAALVGNVSTNVLLWTAAPFINNGDIAGVVPAGTWPPNVVGPPASFPWAVQTQEATLGTVTKITRRGQWLATFSVTVPASGGAVFGISYQTDNPLAVSTPGLLAANTPLNTAPGIRQGVVATAPAATVIPVTLVAQIDISDRDAGDAQSGIIRFHGTNDDAPSTIIVDADIDQAVARYTIAYLGDLMGS